MCILYRETRIFIQQNTVRQHRLWVKHVILANRKLCIINTRHCVRRVHQREKNIAGGRNWTFKKQRTHENRKLCSRGMYGTGFRHQKSSNASADGQMIKTYECTWYIAKLVDKTPCIILLPKSFIFNEVLNFFLILTILLKSGIHFLKEYKSV